MTAQWLDRLTGTEVNRVGATLVVALAKRGTVLRGHPQGVPLRHWPMRPQFLGAV